SQTPPPGTWRANPMAGRQGPAAIASNQPGTCVAVLWEPVWLMRSFTQRTKGGGRGRKPYDLDPMVGRPLVRPDGGMAGRYSKWAKLIYFLGDRWSALNLAGQ